MDVLLKFYASVRLDVRGNTQIKGTGDKKTKMLVETKIKVSKNKVALPQYPEIMYGEEDFTNRWAMKIASDLELFKKAQT